MSVRLGWIPASAPRLAVSLGALGMLIALATPRSAAACGNAMIGAEAGEYQSLANIGVLLGAALLGTRLRTLHSAGAWRTLMLRIAAALVLGGGAFLPLYAGLIAQPSLAMFLLGFTGGAAVMRVRGAPRARRWLMIAMIPWAITTLMTFVSDVRLEGSVDLDARVAAAVAVAPCVLFALTAWIAIEPRAVTTAASRSLGTSATGRATPSNIERAA